MENLAQNIVRDADEDRFGDRTDDVIICVLGEHFVLGGEEHCVAPGRPAQAQVFISQVEALWNLISGRCWIHFKEWFVRWVACYGQIKNETEMHDF